MAPNKDELDRLLDSSYLDGIDRKPLGELRAMRTECQQAEVSLSYLRRLVQGRLDIVHAYMERPDPDSPPDLSTLVEELPGILASGPGRPPGPEHLPLLLSPDTEESELTAGLDSVLGADQLAWLADQGPDELGEIAARLEAFERGVSKDRRALHERIDVLQAELVDRHKTGRATLDGLLS